MLAVVAAAGVFAATAATSGSAATQDTTTATTNTTTTSGAPALGTAPTVSGTAQVGSVFTAAPGTWSGTQPISFAYQWQRCDSSGASCASISGATSQTYTLTTADVGNTVRVQVTATNGSGTVNADSPTSSTVVAAGATTNNTPTPTTGCPSGAAETVVPVTSIAAPALLQVNNFTPVPGTLTASTQSFTLKVIVTDTCNQKVSGALVYATAVPYNQFSVPAEVATGSDGTATLTFNRDTAFPASKRQELLAMFVRARKPGDPVLAGIAARRLIGVPVSLKG
jgi:hypothetical protein